MFILDDKYKFEVDQRCSSTKTLSTIDLKQKKWKGAELLNSRKHFLISFSITLLHVSKPK